MHMADIVISAVSDYPELYNIFNSYKDSQRKCHLVCSVDDCQKKWKNLRDTFVRFKRAAEQQRKASGEPDSHKKNWMHSRKENVLPHPLHPGQGLARRRHK